MKTFRCTQHDAASLVAARAVHQSPLSSHPFRSHSEAGVAGSHISSQPVYIPPSWLVEDEEEAPQVAASIY